MLYWRLLGTEAVLHLPLHFFRPYLFFSRCSIHWYERVLWTFKSPMEQRANVSKGSWRDWLHLLLGGWWPLGDGRESQESGERDATRAGMPDNFPATAGSCTGWLLKAEICSLFQVLWLLSSNVDHNSKPVEMDTVLVEFKLHHLKMVPLTWL